MIRKHTVWSTQWVLWTFMEISSELHSNPFLLLILHPRSLELLILQQCACVVTHRFVPCSVHRNSKSPIKFISSKWPQKRTTNITWTRRRSHNPHRKSICSSQRSSRRKYCMENLFRHLESYVSFDTIWFEFYPTIQDCISSNIHYMLYKFCFTLLAEIDYSLEIHAPYNLIYDMIVFRCLVLFAILYDLPFQVNQYGGQLLQICPNRKFVKRRLSLYWNNMHTHVRCTVHKYCAMKKALLNAEEDDGPCLQ